MAARQEATSGEPRVARSSRCRLEQRLRRRLERLSETLDGAEVAERGMDLVKEIREVHALLRSLEEQAGQTAQSGKSGASGKPGDAAGRPGAGRETIVVVWADAPCGPGPDAGRGTA